MISLEWLMHFVSSRECTGQNHFLPFSVKEKLTADPDSEIATTSLRVSLMCPVGYKIVLCNSLTFDFCLTGTSKRSANNINLLLFLSAWKDASHRSLSRSYLLSPAVF